jgi:hypothetical protein
VDVRWEGNGHGSYTWLTLFVDDNFCGILGRYDEYWLFTIGQGSSQRFTGELSEDEAKAAALALWRMELCTATRSS